MLHTESFGNGPDIIFLHGLFGAGDNWRSIGRQLAEHYRVHLIDLPNHGKSDWIDTQDLATLADMIGQWIPSQGIDRYRLLGHSMGGKIAMQLALNAHPGELQQLIVVDIAPKPYPPHHQDIFKALKRVDFERLTDRKAIDNDMRDLVTDNTVRQFLLKSLYKNGEQLAWRFNVDVLESRYDAVAAAPTISAPFSGPTLFIKGANSNYIEAADQALISRLFPSAKAKIIEGAGHWPHAEKPVVFGKIIKDFFDTES